MKQGDSVLLENSILIDRYKIMKLVDTRPISRIYKGFDLKNNNYVFIKELTTKLRDPYLKQQALEQFKSEAKILFTLKHKSLPKFIDYFDHNDKRYITMEYVEGVTLNTIVEREAAFISEKQVIYWAIELCDFLSYLHTQKPNPIVFKDMRPETIIISEEETLKLIDYGISKIYESHVQTKEIAKIVIPNYSPIEQHTGGTDTRSDIYSLGATMYYLITKIPPMDCMERAFEDEPMKSCREINTAVSGDLEKIIMRAMEIDKGNRYKNIDEMETELLKVLEMPSQEESPDSIHDEISQIASCGISDSSSLSFIESKCDDKKNMIEEKEKINEGKVEEKIKIEENSERFEEEKKELLKMTCPAEKVTEKDIITAEPVQEAKDFGTEKKRKEEEFREEEEKQAMKFKWLTPEEVRMFQEEFSNTLDDKKENIEKNEEWKKSVEEAKKFEEEELQRQAQEEAKRCEAEFSNTLDDKKENKKLMKEQKEELLDNPVIEEEKVISENNLSDNISPVETKRLTPNITELKRDMTKPASITPDLLKDLYETKELIKKSFWSTLYKGIDIKTNQPVVIKEYMMDKLLNFDVDKEVIDKIHKQSRALLYLKHQNLPTFYNYFTCENKNYLIMDYIEGQSLKSMVEDGHILSDWTLIVELALQVCNVLNYLHSRKPKPVIFRVLSPENIILEDTGIIKLIDFGLSKLYEPPGLTLVKPDDKERKFLSPEEYTGKIDVRSDVYCLGITLSYLLTGKMPPESSDRMLYNIPLNYEDFDKSIPPEFIEIILKATEINKNKRFENILIMKECIEIL